MASLTLDHVTKIYDDNGSDVVAVDDVTLEIRDGEFLVLVGPSGCGKSTTLRMVAGLESITSGEIRLGDTVVNDQKPQDRDIAMVFQSYALYPHMSVRGNMRFGLEESTDLADDEIDARVEESASLLDITELLDRTPRELSGGQQQRVALGRAIVRDPEVFLMDEPLSNLDAKLRSQMRTEIQRLQDDLDVTTMYVTHDQTEAMTMGDRIAILDDGRLQQVGTPMECYHAPANQFVAGFVGDPSMNFFPVERDGDVLRAEGFDYPLPRSAAERIDAPGDDLTLGIRPEDVEVVEGSGDRRFETTVDVVEPMGKENNLYLQFPGAEETFVATVRGSEHLERGDAVAVRIPASRMHLFDRRTGEAVLDRSQVVGSPEAGETGTETRRTR
jgi:multiple sugar transport system ATP-binding protein